MEIKTSRLLLRPVTEDDLEAFHKLQSNALVTKYTKQGPSPSLLRSQQLLDDLLVLINTSSPNHPILILAITILSPSSPLIGLIGTFRPRELGFSLHPEFWGLGYAQEATRGFCEWYLKRFEGHVLFAKVDGGNVRSVECLRRCGFGRAREEEVRGDPEGMGRDGGRETWVLRMDRSEVWGD